MRFISHLDLLRLFQRAARRAGLPVSITKGFNPHLKISILRALKLGKESFSEEALFDIEDDVELEPFKDSMNKELPEGVRILKIEKMKG